MCSLFFPWCSSVLLDTVILVWEVKASLHRPSSRQASLHGGQTLHVHSRRTSLTWGQSTTSMRMLGGELLRELGPQIFRCMVLVCMTDQTSHMWCLLCTELRKVTWATSHLHRSLALIAHSALASFCLSHLLCRGV